MDETTPAPKKDIADMSAQEKATMWLSGQVPAVWGPGVTGDFLNAVQGPVMWCSDPETWDQVKKVRTIEEYVGYKMSSVKGGDEIRDLIIAGLNPEFLPRANAIIGKMNEIIGDGIKSQQQVDALLEQYEAFNKWLRNKEG